MKPAVDHSDDAPAPAVDHSDGGGGVAVVGRAHVEGGMKKAAAVEVEVDDTISLQQDAADDYQSQLDIVRRLQASGAGKERVKAAAARLGELKRAVYSSVPRGTASRKKKRKAGYSTGHGGGPLDDGGEDAKIRMRDAAALARYPPPEFPPLDDDGFVLAFAPSPDDDDDDDDDAGDDDDAMVFFRRYGFVVFRGVLTPEARVRSPTL